MLLDGGEDGHEGDLIRSPEGRPNGRANDQ
jgi:hypothetical protein